MLYNSTRNKKISTSGADAIINGIAPDGGLYMPDNLNSIKINPEDILGKNFKEISTKILSLLFTDFSLKEIEGIIEDAYNKTFDAPDITPLKEVGNLHVLELYHGPTYAFKDIALLVLPRLITLAKKKNNVNEETIVLTATSGDTGSAALSGFSNVKNTQMIVFYPKTGVSKTQELQMTTMVGSNLKVCAINGNFDDAQNGVKKAFSEIKPTHKKLSSANSINIGRLAPQIAYYFYSYKNLVNTGTINLHDKINFVVPTGNFGNILAGFLAYKMGLPIETLICASNENKILTDFFKTGIYDRNREFHTTYSPSMDILISSNLERLLYLTVGDTETKKYMDSLNETGKYRLKAEALEELNYHFFAGSATNVETLNTIKQVYEETNYLIDPHTAVAFKVYNDFKKNFDNGLCTVVLSTASPYKFSGSVITALGYTPNDNELSNIELLYEKTGVQIPKNLKKLGEKPILHSDVIEKDEITKYVEKIVTIHH